MMGPNKLSVAAIRDQKEGRPERRGIDHDFPAIVWPTTMLFTR